VERLASYIVYDGNQWWAVTGNRALLSDGALIPREGRLLGLDLDWDETGNHPVKTHSLAAGLKALSASGLVTMAARSKDHDARLVVLIARNPAGGDLPKDVFREHLLEFDPQLGLALVRHEVRIVRKIDQAYLEATTGFTVERWEEFQEFPSGVWLPMRYWAGAYGGVMFPKSGTKYPRGFDFEKSFPKDYRVETFLTGETKARVLKLNTEQQFDPSSFKPDLPRDVIVRDVVNDRSYQTNELIPVNLEDEMRRAIAASRGSGYGIWLWIAAANVVLLGALAVWLWLRRRGAKSGPPKGAAIEPTS
jgi:hypothetical protein